MEMHYNYDFLEVWSKFALHLNANLTRVVIRCLLDFDRCYDDVDFMGLRLEERP